MGWNRVTVGGPRNPDIGNAQMCAHQTSIGQMAQGGAIRWRVTRRFQGRVRKRCLKSIILIVIVHVTMGGKLRVAISTSASVLAKANSLPKLHRCADGILE